MTMAKLAELAGVSVSTVSKAFSGSREISTEKREEIFRIAKEAGCYDKYCKNTYQGIVVAVICHEFKSRFYSEQLSLLEQEIKKHNGTMIVSSTDFSRKRLEELMTFFSEYSKVDGIILMAEPLSAMGPYSVPVIVLGNSEQFDSVVVSESNATIDAIRLFQQHGHRKIAFIGEGHSRRKSEMFRKAMQHCGVELVPEYVRISDTRFESAGYRSMNELLALKDQPTAVIAAYDDIAIGAMKCIYEHGLGIPDDISIIGYDDIKELPYLDVPLTSITSYNEDLCQILVDLLFERITHPEHHITKKIKISRQLVVRESVGKAKEQ